MSEHKLQKDEPLYPKVLWSRPVTKRAAGKLLLIGGHPGNFGMLQAAYVGAIASGAGECTVVVPDSLQGTLAGAPDVVFVPSSPSGSIGKEASERILHLSEDYDAMVLGLNLSNNSETAVLVEALLSRLTLPLIATGETLQAAKFNPSLVTDRPATVIIADMPALYKLAGKLGVGLGSGVGLNGKIAVIDSLSEGRAAHWLHYDGEIIVRSEKETTVTLTEIPEPAYPLLVAAVATFWMQNPAQTTESLTTAAYLISQAIKGAEVPLTTQGLSLALKASAQKWSD
jgi:hypothetical protein